MAALTKFFVPTVNVVAHHPCLAKTTKSNNCRKVGHFAKMCKGPKRVSEVTGTRSTDTTEVPEVTVLSVDSDCSRQADKILCKVQIRPTAAAEEQNTREVELMLDTGSVLHSCKICLNSLIITSAAPGCRFAITLIYYFSKWLRL